MKRLDPKLRCLPWKVSAAWLPVERVLDRLERDSTIDAAGRQIVFQDTGGGAWHDLPEALMGLVDYHRIAASRYGLQVDYAAIEKFANKLRAGSPIFEQDLAAVRASIASCKRQAMQLRLSQSDDIVQTVKISMAMEKKRRAA